MLTSKEAELTRWTAPLLWAVKLLFPDCVPTKQGGSTPFSCRCLGPGHLAEGIDSMKAMLVLLSILGAAAAIPTNARFLSDDSKPTAASLSSAQQPEMVLTPDNTAIPILNAEDAENEEDSLVPTEDQPSQEAEKSSMLDSKEESEDQLAEDDQSNSQELDLKEQEENDSDLGENLEDGPTEETLDLKEDMSEFQEEELPENIDSLTPDVSPIVDTDPQESIIKTEEKQEQPITESHPPSNSSSKLSLDKIEQGSHEQDPSSPHEEEEEEEQEQEEEEKESGGLGEHNGSQDMEREFPKEHPNSRPEEDSTRADAILQEPHQPTQVSKMQQDEFEEENQEEEIFNSEMREEAASVLGEHYQEGEWQSPEAKSGLDMTSVHEETNEKAVAEALLTDPTGHADITPTHQEAESDNAEVTREDQPTPSQASLESERVWVSNHPIKKEEQRERAHGSEHGGGDTREPEEHQGAKKPENSPNEDGSSSEGSARQHSMDTCVNFQCKRGHMCKADPQGRPHCVCQDPAACPPTKLLDQVCGTDNHTYPSSCHLFATKCRLEGTKKGHQLQLDYFGACKSIPACTDFEVTQFPLRMRDWLKNILMQLYESNPEHASYLNEKQRNKVKKIYLDEKRLLAGDHSIDLLLRDFKKNYHMYVYPVHWQFSELDQHPTDRVLTHSELAPLRASLVPMEHCITRFFEECDPNKDKHITLKEWGHCFGIKEEDIDENLLF